MVPNTMSAAFSSLVLHVLSFILPFVFALVPALFLPRPHIGLLPIVLDSSVFYFD